MNDPTRQWKNSPKLVPVKKPSNSQISSSFSLNEKVENWPKKTRESFAPRLCRKPRPKPQIMSSFTCRTVCSVYINFQFWKCSCIWFSDALYLSIQQICDVLIFLNCRNHFTFLDLRKIQSGRQKTIVFITWQDAIKIRNVLLVMDNHLKELLFIKNLFL